MVYQQRMTLVDDKILLNILIQIGGPWHVTNIPFRALANSNRIITGRLAGHLPMVFNAIK